MKNFKHDLQKEKKMEIEEEYNKRHQIYTSERINRKRNLNEYSLKEKEDNEDTQMKNSITDLNIIFQSLQNLIPSNNKIDKNYILNQMKKLRKELSKNSASENDIINIIKKYPNLIGALSNYLLDFKNSELQFETIWVLNNLSIYSFNYHLDFQFNQINQFLIQILKDEKKFSNFGTRNLIFEKVFKFIGKLMFMNDITFNYFIQNNIINILFNCLNSSIRSLRIVCLWNLNQIFTKLIENNYENEIKIFNQKDSLLSYKFILSRIELNQNNSFDEIFEIYWLLNELFKKFPDSVNYIFFFDKDILYKFNHILSFTLIEKLSQPCIRLLSNLIVLNNNIILRDNFINSVFSRKDLIQYIQVILNSDFGKYDISIIKDILLLIFNLFSYSPKITGSFFYENIMKMINNYNNNLKFNDNEISKLLLIIYYQIFNENNNVILQYEEQIIIPFILNNYQNHYNDLNYLLIILDILYFYIKGKGKNLGNQSEYLIKVIIEQNGNIEISNLQSYILEFMNFIQ